MKVRKKQSLHKCTCVTCRHRPKGAVAKEHRAINRVLAVLHEKGRRRVVGLLALQWGRGGLTQLSQITGLSRPTIRRGRDEVQKVERATERVRVRRAGAGRPLTEKNSQVC
jgi:hypothetical protein